MKTFLWKWNTKSRHEKLEVFFQIILFIKYLRRSLSLVELVLLKLTLSQSFCETSMSLSKIIYLLGQHLAAGSKNTWIQAYVSDTQKETVSLYFSKNHKHE